MKVKELKITIKELKWSAKHQFDPVKLDQETHSLK